MIVAKVKAGFDVTISNGLKVSYTAVDLTEYGNGVGVNAYTRKLELFRNDSGALLVSKYLTKSEFFVSKVIADINDLSIRSVLTVTDELGVETIVEDSVAAFTDADPIDSFGALFSQGLSTGTSSSSYSIGDIFKYPISNKAGFEKENIDRYLLVRRGSTMPGSTITSSKYIHCVPFGIGNSVNINWFNEVAAYFDCIWINKATNQILFKTFSMWVAPATVSMDNYDRGIFIGTPGTDPFMDEESAPDYSVVPEPVDLGGAFEDFYENYFENIVNKLKAIGPAEGGKRTFFIIDDMEKISELTESISRGAKDVLLLVELFDDKLTDNNADNYQALIAGAFAVVIKVSSRTKDQERREAKKAAREIGKKIAHKMKWDSLNGPLAERNILCFLNSDGFAVGPVAGSYYGWRYTFEWRAPEVIKLDAGDWYP